MMLVYTKDEPLRRTTLEMALAGEVCWNTFED